MLLAGLRREGGLHQASQEAVRQGRPLISMAVWHGSVRHKPQTTPHNVCMHVKACSVLHIGLMALEREDHGVHRVDPVPRVHCRVTAHPSARQKCAYDMHAPDEFVDAMGHGYGEAALDLLLVAVKDLVGQHLRTNDFTWNLERGINGVTHATNAIQPSHKRCMPAAGRWSQQASCPFPSPTPRSTARHCP